MKKAHLIFYILTLIAMAPCLLYSQNTEADSLKKLLKNDKEDTGKVIHGYQLAAEYMFAGSYDTALSYTGKALQLSQVLKFKKGIANSKNALGNIYLYKGEYDKALENYLASLKIREETGDKNGMSVSHSNIGIIYDNQGMYEKALENYFISLKIRKEGNDKKGIAASCNNIGIIYYKQGINADDAHNKPEAMKFYNKALEHYFIALNIRKEINDRQGVAQAYNNIGAVYDNQYKYDKALENYFASLKIKEEIGDNNGIAASYGNIGGIYTEKGDYQAAIQYLQKELDLSRKINAKEWTMSAYNELAKISARQHDFKNAYQFYLQYTQVKDTLFNQESSKQIAEMHTKYESEKKEQQIAMLNKDKEIQSKELTKQRVIIGAGICGLVLVMAFAFFVSRALNITRRQKAIIQRQKQIVEEHQKEILDSIYYARRIQTALLPTVKYMERNLKRLRKNFD